MDTCTSCGHALGGARFCTSCGAPAQRLEDSTHRVAEPAERTAVLPVVASRPGTPGPADDTHDWRNDTAERPPVPQGSRRPTTPPPSSPPPPPAAMAPGDGPRFPLFADQVDADPVPAPAPAPMPTPATAVVTDGHSHRAPVDRSGARPWLPWAIGALVLVLVAGLGFWLLAGRGDSQSSAAGTGNDAGHSPARSGTTGGSSGSSSGGATDVARDATATVPATAPPNQDLDGNMVRYEARNMLDGVPTTCWRMAGDGTGAELTFDLGAPTTLTEVGLINGYAKTAVDPSGGELDWYHGNRRVLKVEWTFDDGSTVSQDLGDSTRMQSVKVDPVTTQTVRLRLVSVSPPGKGRAARNYTPISDISLVGTPG